MKAKIIIFLFFLLFLFFNKVFSLERTPSWLSADFHIGRWAALADVDGNGYLDLAILDGGLAPIEENSVIKIYFNYEGRLQDYPGWVSFQDENYSPYFNSLAFGDIDNDLLPELAVNIAQKGVVIFKNWNGELERSPSFVSSETGMSFKTGFDERTIAWGDVNGDQFQDLIVAWFSEVRIFINQAGFFNPSADWKITWSPPPEHPFTYVVNIDVKDFNNDRLADVLISYAPSPFFGGNYGIAIFQSLGYSFPEEPYWFSKNSGTVEWVDFDGDGDLDIVMNFSVFINNNGTYPAKPSLKRRGPRGRWGDLNLDGFMDVFFGLDERNICFLNEKGRFNFYPQWLSGDIRPTGGVAIGDLDKNGYLDVACANYGGGILFYQREQSAVYLNYGQFDTSLPPRIRFAGYLSTSLNSCSEGLFSIIANVISPQSLSDIKEVQLFWEGTPTGIYLNDEGLVGDKIVGDGIFSFSCIIPPSENKGEKLLLEIGVEVFSGYKLICWPYLWVKEDFIWN